MGLFKKIKEPVFLKDDSEADRQLSVLQELRSSADGELADQLDEEIRQVTAGVLGEKAVQYELANSHIPMFVLHDLYLENKGLTAQIDYLIVTRKHQFVIECKNLYGNIEINSAGDFTRTVSYGRRTKKEVREQVIKVDQLAQYIRKIDADPKAEETSEKIMEELAQFFLSIHKEPKIDYTEKFRVAVQCAKATAEAEMEELELTHVENTAEILCPKCGAAMVKRKAAKGINTGNEFFGCSKFPKCRGIVNIR